MSIDIRLPNITGATDHDQLVQIRSYLYQFASQLQWALGALESGSGVSGGNAYRSGAESGDGAGGKNQISSFNQIKSLIIKSADIVNAYYEQINARLRGEYVAISDFGTFSEQTTQEIEGNSTAITQLFTNLQEISETVDALYDEQISTRAYMKSGLLYYAEDGSPVYGLEIGQTNAFNGVTTFDKFARFTSDRLSFYDQNDTEVAYISDYKLVITNAEIKGTLKLGGYEIDTTNGLTFKWVGRG